MNRFFLIAIFSILLFFIGFPNATKAQLTYKVSGKVFLQDKLPSGPHSGTKIKFLNLPSLIAKDSTLSNSDGTYAINIAPGYYLIEYSKTGYVPEELGGLALGKDTTLADLTLLPGSVKEVSGYVSGLWTKSFVYYVKSDIIIPSGQSLVIDPGVKIKFYKNTGLTCNGVLIASGSETEKIIFTSREATPTPGDWLGIILNAPNNELRYVYYDWATDGIRGTNATGTAIENTKIKGTLSLNANGIYLTNSQSLNIRENDIQTAGQYGIHAPNSSNSKFNCNTVTGSYSVAAIFAESSSNSTLDSNIVTGRPLRGIYSNSSTNSTFNFNTLDVYLTGIEVFNGGTLQINNNAITNYEEYGIILRGSPNSIVNYNRIISSTNGGYKRGIDNEADNQNMICSYNYVKNVAYWDDNSIGIIGHDSKIENDTVSYRNDSHWYNSAIYANRSSIKNNVITCSINSLDNLDDQNSQAAIKSYGSVSSRSQIENNKIYLGRQANGIRASYSTIIGNQIVKDNDYYGSAWGIISHGNDTITNNNIENIGNGLRVINSSVNNIVNDNKFLVTLSGFYVYGNSTIEARRNLIKTGSGYRGVHFENQSGSKLINNTIFSQGGTEGVWISNLSAPVIKNNIIQGFQKGIVADNTLQNFDITSNDLWNISDVKFSGSAMPPLIGQFVDQNANGDASDIYKNISIDPQYVNADTNNFNLKITSRLINAGDANIVDPDNTPSDIGAYAFYIHIVINHTPLKNTNNITGPYTVSADISSPTGKTVTAKLFYRLNTGAYNELTLIKQSGNIFTASIPGQPLNTKVDYYITGTDGTNSVSSPYLAPEQYYTFTVTLVQTFASLNGSSDTKGDILLTWGKPVLVSGELTSFALYRTNHVNVTETDFHRILDTNATTAKDSLLAEGDVFYYRLGGNVTTQTGTAFIFLSNETKVMSDAAGIVSVKGRIILADTTSYKDVLVEFERTSPTPLIKDTVYTDVNGYFSLTPQIGIYNINIKKYGWQPKQIPNIVITQNLLLDTMRIKRGFGIYLSGNISGTLTNNNIYFVQGTITIPQSDSLVIQAGTKVKFLDFYSLIADGALIAEGDSLNKIEFTSAKATQQKGDWANIRLNGAGNRIRYATYSYASNGIIANNASNTVIENLTITPTLNYDANGIYFTNSQNLRLNYNNISVGGQYGIYAPSSSNSTFNSNTVNGSYTEAAISAESSSNSTFNNNTITGRPFRGIYSIYSNNSTFNFNTIDVGQTGIETTNGGTLQINYNIITNYEEYGILLRGSANSIVNNNRVISSDGGGWKRGIDNEADNQNMVCRYNFVRNSVYEWSYCYGIVGHDSKIENDTIIFANWGYGSAILANRSTIINNNIIFTITNSGNHDSQSAINSTGSPSSRSIIENNKIYLSNDGNGIRASFATITNNQIIKDNDYYGTSWGIISHGNDTIMNNSIENIGNAFRAVNSSVNNIVTDNKFIVTQAGFYIVNNSNMIARQNLIKVGNGNGIYIENQSGEEFTNNTIIGNGGSYGIFITNLSNPKVNNNNIQGFQTGLRAESRTTIINYNNIYSNTIRFSGNGLPTIIGEVTTNNSNGTPCDVYSNIFNDPLFVNPSTDDYTINFLSPLINAGNPALIDVDGTASDIGAYFYNFGYVPQNVKVDSTGNNFVAISWTIPLTDSLSGYKPYYKLHSVATWESFDNVTGKSFTFTGLVNNQDYDFTLKAIYNNRESNFSKIISARPGLGKITVSPGTLIVSKISSDTSQITLTLSNSGNKDVDFSISKSSFSDLDVRWSDTTGYVNAGATKNILLNVGASSSGIQNGNLIVKSNSNSFVETLPFLVISGSSYGNIIPANNFPSVTPTSNSFLMIVDNCKIDGETIVSGDELALYTGSICTGTAKFGGQFPFIIKAYAQDGNFPGYNDGDSIIVQVWKFNSSRITTLTLQVTSGSGKFKSGEFARVNLSGTIYNDLLVTVKGKKFNLVSFPLLPQNNNVSQVFNSPAVKIVYEDNGKAFIPQYQINNIGSINLAEGYHVFATADFTINTSGLTIKPSNYPLYIERNRFNSIAYLYENPMPIETAFAGIRNRVKIVQDDGGSVWIPSLSINTIGSLQPKKGYQIFSDSSTNFNFVYPPYSFGKINVTEKINTQMVHFQFSETGLPYSIIVSLNETTDIPENGIEIGIFDGSDCVGGGILTKEKLNILTAWKGDSVFNLKGFKPGNKILFKTYSDDFNNVGYREATFKVENHAFFAKDAYSIATLNLNKIEKITSYSLSKNYPNPFNPTTSIRYQVPKVSKVKIVVFNLLGQAVKTLIDDETHASGSFEIVWNGKNNGNEGLPSGIYFIQLISGEYKMTQKAVLLK